MTIPFLFRSAFLASTLSLLSGCIGLNSQFDCPMKPGVMCKSLDEVNALVDQGKLGSDSFSSDPATTQIAAKSSRIWIAPGGNQDGNYDGNSCGSSFVEDAGGQAMEETSFQIEPQGEA